MVGHTALSGDEKAILAEYGSGNLDEIIPALARDQRAMRRIEHAARARDTSHDLILGNARSASALEPESVHFVVTSPPYWTLKRWYPRRRLQ